MIKSYFAKFKRPGGRTWHVVNAHSKEEAVGKFLKGTKNVDRQGIIVQRRMPRGNVIIAGRASIKKKR
jgi:hypothetical protein